MSRAILALALALGLTACKGPEANPSGSPTGNGDAAAKASKTNYTPHWPA